MLDEHLFEEAQRERDLRSNIRLDDGKMMFPSYNAQPVVKIDITKQLKEIENLIIDKHGRIIGKKDEIFGKHWFLS